MKDLSTYIVTFNCARTLVEPEHFSKHFFDVWKAPVNAHTKLPDVIILNLQEIAPISRAFIGGSLVEPYFNRLRKSVELASAQSSHFGAYDYFNVLSRNAGLTAIMVFVRDDLTSHIQSIEVAQVGVGASQMGNKGAIGARVGWLVMDNQPLLYTTFVSAHLAPFEEEISRRNQDYINIVRGISFVGSDAVAWKKSTANNETAPLLSRNGATTLENPSNIGLYSDDTHFFFAGDLNYRTALTGPSREDELLFPQPSSNRKDPQHFCQLLEKDQLSQELHSGRTLHGLSEQPIDFCPTYKYKNDHSYPVLQDKDMNKWAWAKHRWPSWCDRILYSGTEQPNVVLGQYSSLPLFRTSDHRPVALCVSIPYQAIRSSQLSNKAPAQINPDWQSQRDIARKKEFMVGVGAYLSTTWEGNTVLFGAVLIIVSGVWLSKSIA